MLEEQPYGFEDRGKTFLPSYLKRSAPQWRFLRLCDGFTLIEILVAMAILGICLVTILQLFSGGLKSSKVSDEYTRAIFHAREKMEEILLAEELTEEALAGDFGNGFEWNAEISRVQLDEEEDTRIPVDTYAIKVQVQWSEGRHGKDFEISTLKIAEKVDES